MVLFRRVTKERGNARKYKLRRQLAYVALTNLDKTEAVVHIETFSRLTGMQQDTIFTLLDYSI